ncbi:MAG: hypothetical protein JNL32_13440, partial [Candidatus Kapabacteria bacterium]|nr:hypothetical protein [Candidatus Kapabacteria bacterium]
MTLHRVFAICIFFTIQVLPMFGQKYKDMMNDPNINFNEVVREAEAYFGTNDKGKGSGYKPYLRWRYNNESKYYPTGERNLVPMTFSEDSWAAFMQSDAVVKQSNTLQAFPNGWVELGPRYVNRITTHYAPGLGRIENFFVSKRDTNRIYLGSRSGGFWRTSDGGKTWQNTTDKLPASGVNAIAVSPTNDNNVVINVQNGYNGTTLGLYRSSDGGLTWRATAFVPSVLGKGGLGSNFGINQIAFSPHNDNLILISAADGLYRSDDNLQTWQKITDGSISEIEFHPTNPNIIYIYDYYYWGTNKNVILRSVDAGRTFTTSTTLVGNNDNTGVRLAVSANCPNCVYFASVNGVWRSSDNGANFTFIAKPPKAVDGFAVNDKNERNMVTGAVDTWVSTDGGANFTQRTWWSLGSTPFNGPSYVHADIRDAQCVNGVFYVATDGYLARSRDNGITWERISEGTGIRENYSLCVSQSNTYRNYLGSQDNGQSLMTENGWLEIMGADGMEGVIHTLNDDWIMGSWQFGGRLRYKDGGLSSQQVTPPGQKNGGWIAPFFSDPNNPMRVWSVSDSVYRSDDFGSTWTNIGTTTIGTASEAAVAENNSDIIYLSAGSALVKSTNGGRSFVRVNGLPNFGITDIAISPRNDNVVVVTYNRYQRDTSKVFITMNGGSTWTNISANLRDLPVTAVVIDHTPESNIYLGTEHGVVYKKLTDTDWKVYNPNLPNVSVQDIKVHYGTNTLRIGSWGRGLWEYALIGRNSYPEIRRVRIINQPTDNSPKLSQAQFVTAHVVYGKQLTKVAVQWSKDQPQFSNEIAMQKVNDTTYKSISPLPQFPVGTKMYFRVIANGTGNENSETYKFMYTVQPFKYCDAIGADNTTADYITRVALAGSEYTSQKEKYGDFTDKYFTLFTDSTYTLTVGMNFHWEQDTTAAWIDYNHDAEFDETEKITMGELNAQHVATGTFRVPADVANDTTRIRVRSQYWNESPNPCGSRTGEVEDYTVVFRRAPKVAFTTSMNQLCSPQDVTFSYSGDAVDSVQWELRQGTLLQASGRGLQWTRRFNITGTYDVTVRGFKDGVPYTSLAKNIVTLNIIDTTVKQQFTQLTSNEPDAQYQWLDCTASLRPVPGATLQS